MQCPDCGGRLKGRSWKDDVHGSMVTVEEVVECPSCGHRDGHAYGRPVAYEPQRGRVRKTAVGCFICGCPCPSLHGDGVGGLEEIPPVEGLVFRTTGNFGTTLFDPMDHRVLQIVICDDCVKQRTHKVTYFASDRSAPEIWTGQGGREPL